MRIGLVCPYQWDVPGGVQYHVRDLAQTLRGMGHHVEVLTPAEREDLDVVAHAAQRLRQVAHVVLHPPGHVPLVGADQADAHQADPGSTDSSAPTSAQIRPSMCQSSGWSPMEAVKASATRCMAAGARSRSRPGPATGTSG